MTAEERISDLEDVLIELLAVANLRMDDVLPNPEDDPKLWTARMADAWNEAWNVMRRNPIADARYHDLVKEGLEMEKRHA